MTETTIRRQKLEQLLLLVKEMRGRQNDYYYRQTKSAHNRKIAYEEQVDKIVDLLLNGQQNLKLVLGGKDDGKK